MIYTDGKPTICSVRTYIKPIEKSKRKSYKLLIRDLVRIQHADYLHTLNLCSDDGIKGYWWGKINACLDILDRIEAL